MKAIRIIILTIFVATSIRSQNLIGGATGFDWIEGFYANPIYANKDINLYISHSKNNFILEARQGVRYLEGFDAVRNSTYLLIGYTTLREKFFVFDISVGGALSWTTGGKYRYYPVQINPALKTSFDFRINSRLYLGVDWLCSSYFYYQSSREFFDFTGSFLLSLNYVLPKRQNKEKTSN
jgi:hypothetical protein